MIVVHGDDGGAEMEKACAPIANALLLREKYRPPHTSNPTPEIAALLGGKCFPRCSSSVHGNGNGHAT